MPGWDVLLDGAAESVINVSARFAGLLVESTGQELAVGSPAGDVFGRSNHDWLCAVFARARAEGSAAWILHGWGRLHRGLRVDVRREPGGATLALSVHEVPLDAGIDPDGLLGPLLSQNLTDMVLVVDRDLRIRACNAVYAVGAEAVGGRPVKVGDLLRDRLPDGIDPDWAEPYRRALAGESLVADTSFGVGASARLTYELSMNPLRGGAGSGEVKGVAVISRNVTQSRTDAEAARRAAEHRRAILEAMPEAITVFDRDGNIVDFKPASDIPTPKDPRDYVGRNLREMTHVPVAEILALLDRAFETCELQHLDYDALVDGVVRKRAAVLRAFSAREAVWVVRDVTDQLEHARRMGFADRMASLGTLAAGVAHELNNPLAFVTANVAYVSETLDGSAALAPEASAALAESLHGLERMRTIVAGMRAFSKPQPEEPASVLLAPVVTGALKLTHRELAPRASVEVDLDGSLWVCASEVRLSQVFVNILLNAAQAFDVAQRDRNVLRVVCEHRGGRAEVSITDNGPGIPPEVRRRIFDPFFTTKPVGAGTGLGLAIAQQIVRSAEGEILVMSEPDVATTFRVVLPLSTAPTPEPAPGSAAESREVRVLLIDDDPGVRSGLARLLREWQVSAVVDAQAGLRALERGDFDLVLCDLDMPDQTGVDFYIEVTKRWPERQATVVLMSGGGLSPVHLEALAGIVTPPLLEKPFGVAEVEDHVQRLRALASGGVEGATKP